MSELNITSPSHGGFQVRIVRCGKEASRYFSHKIWGGEEKALEAARSYRDQLLCALREKKTLSSNQSLSHKKTTGVRGVSRSIKYDKRRDLRYVVYSVCWYKNGIQKTKTFQVSGCDEMLADEEFHAFRTAVRFRYEYELFRDEGVILELR